MQARTQDFSQGAPFHFSYTVPLSMKNCLNRVIQGMLLWATWYRILGCIFSELTGLLPWGKGEMIFDYLRKK